MTIQEFYKSKEWQEARQIALKRDKYTCRFCDRQASECHHIIHLTDDNVSNQTITLSGGNIISLCRRCHLKEHSNA